MKRYTGKYTEKIIFPLGGIGTGCIGLAGDGRLVDWEIFNRPNKLTSNGCSHLAVRAELEGRVLDTRILAGEFAGDRMGTRNYFSADDMFGFGAPRGSLGGAPHFESVVFGSEFPFAFLRFEDHRFPGVVEMTAFNPFIPLNEADSCLPGAMFQVKITNPGAQNIRYTLVLVAHNPWKTHRVNRFSQGNPVSRITLSTLDREQDNREGEIVLATDAETVSFQENFFRGSWFDSLAVYFRELKTSGKFKNRSFGVTDAIRLPGGLEDAHGHALLAAHKEAAAGKSCEFRMVIAWRVPFCRNYWDDKLDPDELIALGVENRWTNHYAKRFPSAAETADYLLMEFDRLHDESMRFTRAFYDSTLPEVFLEAAGANLSTLKTPTCLRLEDGAFYGFEGCAPTSGCCEGSCTHVWNYAYALPYLFPGLERSMRELEYRYNLLDNGEMTMRLMLPPGRKSRYRACVDGQFGSIIKVYREWKLSGDDNWMLSLWPRVRRSLEYAWSPGNHDRWDPEMTGLLIGRQHHTLDMELFGPNSWLSGFYLAALEAAARMAEFAGEEENARLYREIAARGRRELNSRLFNGEYFCQRVELNDRSLLEPYSGQNGWFDKTVAVTVFDSYWNEEHAELKYQVGEGCGIDQMLGQWHASLNGLGDIFEQEKALRALRAIYRNNFREEVGEIFNPCRLYSLGRESGTVICDWPEGRRKPWIPLTYAEETMPGFEYALAGQMIRYGMVAEAERIVKAVRDRHDGSNRNPWNEMECGSNYARSMASYAFLPAFSGFLCDASKREMVFSPVTVAPGKEFRCFWSMGTAWGVYRQTAEDAELRVLYGELELKKFSTSLAAVRGVKQNGNAVVFTAKEGKVTWRNCLKIGPMESIEITTRTEREGVS